MEPNQVRYLNQRKQYIDAWIDEHEKTHHSKGYEFLFLTTNEGISGKIRCTSCGMEYRFDEQKNKKEKA